MEAIEARMASLELRMQELENRCVESESQLSKRHDKVLEEAGVRVSDEENLHHNEIEPRQSSATVTKDDLQVLIGTSSHTIADTVHEAILLVGTGGIGPGSQALVVLGFLVNVIVQTLFCVIIGNSFLNSPYHPVSIS